MKTLKFDNGLSVASYIGDGFDGASGMNFRVPRESNLSIHLAVEGLSDEDKKRLRAFVLEHMKKDLDLEYRCLRGSTNKYCFKEHFSSAESAVHLIGQIDLMLNQKAKVYKSYSGEPDSRYWPE